MKKNLAPYYLVLAALCAASLTSCIKKAPVTAEETPSGKPQENIVALTPANLQHVSIETETVARGNLEMTLAAAGRLSENLNETAKVASTFDGRLTALRRDLNEHVVAGEVLALVQTPELLGKSFEVKAPIGGVITERKGTIGELVGKDSAIYTISNPANLWAIAEIKERDIALVKTGQDASFTVLAWPEEKFHGKVVLLGNRVEEDSRTLEVRIEVDNTDGRLKPGMFADVQIVTTVRPDVLLISDKALQSEGENQTVFVALGSNRFEKRIIQTGMEQDGQIELLEGAKEGEKVVTTGSFILKSELLKGELGEE